MSNLGLFSGVGCGIIKKNGEYLEDNKKLSVEFVYKLK